jgi:hypothetical protein
VTASRFRATTICVAFICGVVFLELVSGQQVRIRVRAGQGSGSSAVANPIAAARLPSGSATLPEAAWSIAGVTGGISTTRTQCGSTIAAYGTSGTPSSAATINTALSACTAGHYVLLGAGTFHLNTTITFGGTANVTLKGAGADQTFIVMHNSNCCLGFGDSSLFMGSSTLSMYVDSTTAPPHSASLSGTMTKGTTSLTFSSTTGLVVGGTVMFDQLDDSSDPGDTYICSTKDVCSQEGPGGGGRTGRAQNQVVVVTAINGSTVTFTPGLYMPNWRTGQTPQAWWGSSAYWVEGEGVEDLSIDHTLASAQKGFFLFNCLNCWIKGVRALNAPRSHVWLYQSPHCTIRDSYFFEGQDHASQSYGVEFWHTSDDLVENNIFQKVTLPANINAAASGSVVAYNYFINDLYNTAVWMQGSNQHHEGGTDFILHEGNDGPGFTTDDTHGTGNFFTAFRNYFVGWETGKTAQSTPMHLYAYHRYLNIVGNVLGRSGFHTSYECAPATNTSANCSPDNGDLAIFTIGFSGNGGGKASTFNNDTLAKSTLFRWGNYDTVNAAVRWNTGEVPSGISPYPNPVPSSQTLPDSLYLSAKPAFYGSNPWPSIGPDISDGTVTGVASHVRRIPARICFEDVMGGAFGDTVAKTFSRSTCYP